MNIFGIKRLNQKVSDLEDRLLLRGHQVTDLVSRVNALNDRYWRLQNAHQRLLDYLGVNEVEYEAKTVLEKKGGPERGE